MNRYFVTGTDTDAGKTLVSAALLTKARRQGLSTLGLKPVAAGCERNITGLSNADACLLMARSYPEVDYTTVNPISLEPPIAPHLAALRAGLALSLGELESTIRATLQNTPRDLALIEGAGGWRVPLNDNEDLSGLAIRLGLPVILVIGVRLGCINHARLTLEAIRSDRLEIAGWVATQTDPLMSEYEANLASLHHYLDAPCLGSIPWLGHCSLNGHDSAFKLQEKAADYIELPCKDD